MNSNTMPHELYDDEELAAMGLERRQGVAGEGEQHAQRNFVTDSPALFEGAGGDAQFWDILDGPNMGFPITLEKILALHLRVLRDVPGTSGYAGRLRNVDVSVGDYDAPAHAYVAAKMGVFIDQLNTDYRRACRGQVGAAELAAFAHYQLTLIHPFRNANGRTGRLLMNHVLKCLGQQMIIVPEDLRDDYYDSLIYANTHNDDLGPLITFISNLMVQNVE